MVRKRTRRGAAPERRWRTGVHPPTGSPELSRGPGCKTDLQGWWGRARPGETKRRASSVPGMLHRFSGIRSHCRPPERTSPARSACQRSLTGRRRLGKTRFSRNYGPPKAACNEAPATCLCRSEATLRICQRSPARRSACGAIAVPMSRTASSTRGWSRSIGSHRNEAGLDGPRLLSLT
jgi:hypothetical protein